MQRRDFPLKICTYPSVKISLFKLDVICAYPAIDFGEGNPPVSQPGKHKFRGENPLFNLPY